MTTTGKWCQPDVPHRGWQCVGITDLARLAAICEMCEVQPIRYVHHMWHSDYGALDVGCICAGHMEQNLARAREREEEMKRKTARRKRWRHRDWRTSGNGNSFINTPDGFNVVVFQNGTSWSARFVDKRTGYSRFSQRAYGTEFAAKVAVLDAMSAYKSKRERSA